MTRSAGNVLLAAAMVVVLAGCAYQDTLELPDLDPPAASGAPQYGTYSPYYSRGYGYGYGSGYRPGYDPYYNYYYGGADPRYYYGPGVVYVPYPVPCADANHDGRCDKRPRGDGHDDDQDDDGHHHDNPPDGKHDGIPRWQQPGDAKGGKGEGPRVRRDGDAGRYGTPGMTPRVAPAPGNVQPAPAQRTAPPASRPPQVRPQEMPRRAAPPPADRGPRMAPARPPVDDGSPARSPD